MTVDNKELAQKFKSVFKLNYPPIAFFYTNNPPIEVYNPKRTSGINFPCIIQLLNGVKSGSTLVLGKRSRNLCPGGLTYLGFKKPMKGLENFLSTGIPGPKEGEIIMEGERFAKTPELAKKFLDKIPFRKSSAEYAVFMPLDQVNPKQYEPQLVIFYVKNDQLAGLNQLANFDTLNRTILGIGSACSTIITESLAEIENNDEPRPVLGLLSDILARRHVKPDEVSFTVGYKKLIQMYNNIEESFLKLEAWNTIYNRI
ncbi:MAG: DUF169 domain-containing protein [Promethearchaeota archaeon]